jgi:hypothetical protein
MLPNCICRNRVFNRPNIGVVLCIRIFDNGNRWGDLKFAPMRDRMDATQEPCVHAKSIPTRTFEKFAVDETSIQGSRTRQRFGSYYRLLSSEAEYL